MKFIINTISKAIDCPLMDTHNIPFEIAGYLSHKIFYLNNERKVGRHNIIISEGRFLATNEEHAWELYEQYSKDLFIDYRVEKGEFMKSLSYDNRFYITTNGGSVRHLKIYRDFDDESVDLYMIEYEYKRPTRNVIRKQIAQ
jgi:hypothetical protein